jgi:hypothetical protein
VDDCLTLKGGRTLRLVRVVFVGRPLNVGYGPGRRGCVLLVAHALGTCNEPSSTDVLTLNLGVQKGVIS